MNFSKGATKLSDKPSFAIFDLAYSFNLSIIGLIATSSFLIPFAPFIAFNIESANIMTAIPIIDNSSTESLPSISLNRIGLFLTIRKRFNPSTVPAGSALSHLPEYGW
ncbi:hypothetical protein D3C80_1488640 [compost metagenome]